MTDHIHSLPQVAEQLHLSRRRVRDLAERRGLGGKIGKVWLFTDEDLENMRNRGPDLRKLNPATQTDG